MAAKVKAAVVEQKLLRYKLKPKQVGSPKGPYTASLSMPPNPNFTHSTTLPT